MVEYHRILEPHGMLERIKKLKLDLESKFGTQLSMALTYTWPLKFESLLYNAKSALERSSSSVEQILVNNNKEQQCMNAVCRKFINQPLLHEEEVTGECLNTGDCAVIGQLTVHSEAELEAVYGVVGMGVAEWNSSVQEIQRRVEGHLKRRAISVPADSWLDKFLTVVQGEVINSTQKEVEMHEQLGLSSMNYTPILNLASRAKLLGQFGSDIKEAFQRGKAKLIEKEEKQTVSGKCTESTVQRVLKKLQGYVTFVKHDKEAGRTQIMCASAAQVMTAQAFRKQKRFVSLGKKGECGSQIILEAKHFYHGRDVGCNSKGSLVRQLCDLYGIDEAIISYTIFANELTINFKAHKFPPELRIIIGCVDREGRENFYRRIHHILRMGLHMFKIEYEKMVKEGGGKQKRKVNFVEDIQSLARRVRVKGHTGEPLATADVEKCFPQHSVAVNRGDKKEGEEELVGPLVDWEWGSVEKEKRIRQPLIAEMFAAGDGGPLYVRTNSSLVVVKKLLQEVMDHVKLTEGEEVAMRIAKGRSREPSWAIKGVSEKKPNGREVWLDLNQFMRLLVGSLSNQIVCFGEETYRVSNGLVEGQETSSLVQTLFFQSAINVEVDSLIEQHLLLEAQKVQEGIDTYIDDALSLNGALGPRTGTLMRGQFHLNYEEHQHKVTYVGVEMFKCTRCEAGMGTRPTMEKHKGHLFSANLMDNWNQDNSPTKSKLGIVTGSLVRVHRLSSDAYPILQGVMELVSQAKEKGYPMNRVCGSIRRAVEQLVDNEPRPEEGQPECQQLFRQYLIDGVDRILTCILLTDRVKRKTLKRKIQKRINHLRKYHLCAQCFAVNPPQVWNTNLFCKV